MQLIKTFCPVWKLYPTFSKGNECAKQLSTTCLISDGVCIYMGTHLNKISFCWFIIILKTPCAYLGSSRCALWSWDVSFAHVPVSLWLLRVAFVVGDEWEGGLCLPSPPTMGALRLGCSLDVTSGSKAIKGK